MFSKGLGFLKSKLEVVYMVQEVLNNFRIFTREITVIIIVIVIM